MVAEPPTRILFRPLQDFVLMVPLVDGATEAGIMLPEQAAKAQAYRPRRARVIAVGPGAHQDGVYQPTTVKVGQVVFPAGSHMVLSDRGQEYWVCNEGALMGVEE